MNKQKNLEKLIFDIFDKEIEGTDIYNHDGSMWLIFTEERKWVVEFTKEKTLWYNYKHFNDILVLFGMELSEGDEYIKKWYEERFLFKPKIVDDSIKDRIFFVEDVIDNGVKNSQSFDGESLKLVNKIIDDGVKHTEWAADLSESIEDTIQNGVNVISWAHPIANHSNQVDDIIQNGVKKISYHQKGSWNEYMSDTSRVKDTIQNGVKETKPMGESLKLYVDETIEKGVKEISSVDFEYPRATENVIKNGVKEMYSLSEDLEQEVDYAIYEGVKEVLPEKINQEFWVDETIKEGVKYMMSDSEFKNNQVEDIIKYSEKL